MKSLLECLESLSANYPPDKLFNYRDPDGKVSTARLDELTGAVTLRPPAGMFTVVYTTKNALIFGADTAVPQGAAAQREIATIYNEDFDSTPAVASTGAEVTWKPLAGAEVIQLLVAAFKESRPLGLSAEQVRNLLDLMATRGLCPEPESGVDGVLVALATAKNFDRDITIEWHDLRNLLIVLSTVGMVQFQHPPEQPGG